MNITYAVGDTVVQSTHLGGLRYVVVTERLADVKNGRPGFDGQIAGTSGDGGAVWGYDDQIMRVIPAGSGPALFAPGHRLGSAWR